jgi:hypothetical protein
VGILIFWVVRVTSKPDVEIHVTDHYPALRGTVKNQTSRTLRNVFIQAGWGVPGYLSYTRHKQKVSASFSDPVQVLVNEQPRDDENQPRVGLAILNPGEVGTFEIGNPKQMLNEFVLYEQTGDVKHPLKNDWDPVYTPLKQ